ncbi:unnamed protein product, partial [Mesorhabditis belari]|uniref:SH3 domain-containing protein n=1 Tax=Mesorhabditis belari TaxID=2138241 RepID=A0AAF3E9X6_9BILA
MGNVFRKKKLAAEELESLSTQTKAFREEIEATFQQKKATLRYLTLFVFFAITSITSYVIIKFDRERQIEFSLLALLGGSLVLYSLRKLANFYYSYVVSRKQRYLDDAIERKRKILENVKETETFKVAKELLEKYDDDASTSDEAQPPSTPKPTTTAVQPPKSPNKNETLVNRKIVQTPGQPNTQPPTNQSSPPKPTDSQPDRSTAPPPQRPPVRPYIREGKTVTDKLIDYFFGDGPNNRFALICGRCHNHNGMALPGEFEYLAFTCFHDVGGGMANSDLRGLFDLRIPEHRSTLEKSQQELNRVADYCETHYLQSHDKKAALNETKQYTVRSLASVAYQINTLARDLLDMMDLQTEKVQSLSAQMSNLNLIVSIHKEKSARRDIGALTTNKVIQKQPKIIQPMNQEPVQRYKRTPIDYTVLDSVGHGTKTEPSVLAPRGTTVSRATSSISGAAPSQYSHYGQLERTANINNTISRSSMRSGMFSTPQSEHHYRIPQVGPYMDGNNYSNGNQYHISSASTAQAQSIGNYAMESEYGGSQSTMDRYGTLRALRNDQTSPDFPLPPPLLQLHSDYGQAPVRQSLPPPPTSLNTLDDDLALPPPPNMQQSFFDTRPDWIPSNYIEKAVVLYDYDADRADELSLRENSIVYVLRKNDDGWFEGVFGGKTGLFPGNYVQLIEES